MKTIQERCLLCVSNREEGLEYDNMMVMTLDMPSGFQPEDLQVAKKQNPSVVRLEQDKQQLHFYMSQVMA